MSAEESESKPVATASPIQLFIMKVGVVLAASLLFFAVAVMYVETEIQEALVNLKRTPGMNGGPAFWSSVEKNLYDFADGKDLPPEKRAKILAALKRIGQKYGPFLDALNSR
jgi:hypothetical protein